MVLLTTDRIIRYEMTRILLFILLSVTLTLTGCCRLALADEQVEGTFRVKLFDCQLPIPVSYAINGRELNRIVLSRDYGETGRIVISKFAGYGEMYEVSDERTFGHLTVAELINHREWKTPNYDMTIIRDDESILALMGAARALRASMVEACLSDGE